MGFFDKLFSGNSSDIHNFEIDLFLHEEKPITTVYANGFLNKTQQTHNKLDRSWAYIWKISSWFKLVAKSLVLHRRISFREDAPLPFSPKYLPISARVRL